MTPWVSLRDERVRMRFDDPKARVFTACAVLFTELDAYGLLPQSMFETAVQACSVVFGRQPQLSPIHIFEPTMPF